MQTLAGSREFLKKPRELQPKNVDLVDELSQIFSQFISMHDRTLSTLRTRRRNHHELVSRYYTRLMEMIGEDVAIIQNMSDEYYRTMQYAVILNEGMTPCLTEIQDRKDRLLEEVNIGIQFCGQLANTSMAANMRGIFYPTFDLIQQEHSLYPFYALVALSRANALTDQEQVVKYMRSLFQLKEISWLENVETSFRWEERHFEVQGDFLLEQMNRCTGTDAVRFLVEIIELMRQIGECPLPPTLVPPPENTPEN